MFVMVIIIKHYWTNKIHKTYVDVYTTRSQGNLSWFPGKIHGSIAKYSTWESSSYSDGNGSNDSIKYEKPFSI